MPRHFKIHELLDSQQLRDLEAFAREPGNTIDACEQWLLERQFAVSRGAVWAWRASFLVDDKMRASAELAREFMAATGKDSVSMSDAAMNQLGQIIFEQTVALQTESGVQTKDVVNMTAALKNLVTGKRHLETLRDEMKERFDAVVDGAKKKNPGGAISADDIAQARVLIFGK